jgi:hypothetical protein
MNTFQFKAYVTITVPIDEDLDEDEQGEIINKATTDFQDAINDFAESKDWTVEDVELK